MWSHTTTKAENDCCKMVTLVPVTVPAANSPRGKIHMHLEHYQHKEQAL